MTDYEIPARGFLDAVLASVPVTCGHPEYDENGQAIDRPEEPFGPVETFEDAWADEPAATASVERCPHEIIHPLPEHGFIRCGAPLGHAGECIGEIRWGNPERKPFSIRDMRHPFV